MDYEPKVKNNGKTQLDNFKGKIEFRNACFSYPSTKNVKIIKICKFK